MAARPTPSVTLAGGLTPSTKGRTTGCSRDTAFTFTGFVAATDRRSRRESRCRPVSIIITRSGSSTTGSSASSADTGSASSSTEGSVVCGHDSTITISGFAETPHQRSHCDHDASSSFTIAGFVSATHRRSRRESRRRASTITAGSSTSTTHATGSSASTTGRLHYGEPSHVVGGYPSRATA